MNPKEIASILFKTPFLTPWDKGAISACPVREMEEEIRLAIDSFSLPEERKQSARKGLAWFLGRQGKQHSIIITDEIADKFFAWQITQPPWNTDINLNRHKQSLKERRHLSAHHYYTTIRNRIDTYSVRQKDWFAEHLGLFFGDCGLYMYAETRDQEEMLNRCIPLLDPNEINNLIELTEVSYKEFYAKPDDVIDYPARNEAIKPILVSERPYLLDLVDSIPDDLYKDMLSNFYAPYMTEGQWQFPKEQFKVWCQDDDNLHLLYGGDQSPLNPRFQLLKARREEYLRNLSSYKDLNSIRGALLRRRMVISDIIPFEGLFDFKTYPEQREIQDYYDQTKRMLRAYIDDFTSDELQKLHKHLCGYFGRTIPNDEESIKFFVKGLDTDEAAVLVEESRETTSLFNTERQTGAAFTFTIRQTPSDGQLLCDPVNNQYLDIEDLTWKPMPSDIKGQSPVVVFVSDTIAPILWARHDCPWRPTLFAHSVEKNICNSDPEKWQLVQEAVNKRHFENIRAARLAAQKEVTAEILEDEEVMENQGGIILSTGLDHYANFNSKEIDKPVDPTMCLHRKYAILQVALDSWEKATGESAQDIALSIHDDFYTFYGNFMSEEDSRRNNLLAVSNHRFEIIPTLEKIRNTHSCFEEEEALLKLRLQNSRRWQQLTPEQLERIDSEIGPTISSTFEPLAEKRVLDLLENQKPIPTIFTRDYLRIHTLQLVKLINFPDRQPVIYDSLFDKYLDERSGKWVNIPGAIRSKDPIESLYLHGTGQNVWCDAAEPWKPVPFLVKLAELHGPETLEKLCEVVSQYTNDYLSIRQQLSNIMVSPLKTINHPNLGSPELDNRFHELLKSEYYVSMFYASLSQNLGHNDRFISSEKELSIIPPISHNERLANLRLMIPCFDKQEIIDSMDAIHFMESTAGSEARIARRKQTAKKIVEGLDDDVISTLCSDLDIHQRTKNELLQAIDDEETINCDGWFYGAFAEARKTQHLKSLGDYWNRQVLLRQALADRATHIYQCGLEGEMDDSKAYARSRLIETIDALNEEDSKKLEKALSKYYGRFIGTTKESVRFFALALPTHKLAAVFDSCGVHPATLRTLLVPPKERPQIRLRMVPAPTLGKDVKLIYDPQTQKLLSKEGNWVNYIPGCKIEGFPPHVVYTSSSIWLDSVSPWQDWLHPWQPNESLLALMPYYLDPANSDTFITRQIIEEMEIQLVWDRICTFSETAGHFGKELIEVYKSVVDESVPTPIGWATLIAQHAARLPNDDKRKELLMALPGLIENKPIVDAIIREVSPKSHTPNVLPIIGAGIASATYNVLRSSSKPTTEQEKIQARMGNQNDQVSNVVIA